MRERKLYGSSLPSIPADVVDVLKRTTLAKIGQNHALRLLLGMCVCVCAIITSSHPDTPLLFFNKAPQMQPQLSCCFPNRKTSKNSLFSKTPQKSRGG